MLVFLFYSFSDAKDSLELQCNYERYRTLVQIEVTGGELDSLPSLIILKNAFHLLGSDRNLER